MLVPGQCCQLEDTVLVPGLPCCQLGNAECF
jgi:hypothetical protein